MAQSLNTSLKVAAALAAIPAIVGAVILNTFVFSVLWGWFIMPLGVPSLTMVHAFGVILTFNLLTAKFATSREVESKDEGKSALERLWTRVSVGYAVPSFALLFGWIVVSVWGVA